MKRLIPILIICFTCFKMGIQLDMPGISETMLVGELLKKTDYINIMEDVVLGFRKSRELGGLEALKYGDKYNEYKHKEEK